VKGLTDIPGIRVGHASDFEALTGCTAIICEKGAVGGVDIRGSATGSEELDVLRPGHVTGMIHAIVLAGGSAFGLEAASGVRRHLERKGVGFPTSAGKVPLVAGAILFDLGLGKSGVRPTREMGEAAAAAATDTAVEEGCVGAGTGATVGKLLGMKQAMKSGIGSATVPLEGALAAVKVSALAAVNAIGCVRDPSTGKLIAGVRKSASSNEIIEGAPIVKQRAPQLYQREATTLVVVATNARLNPVEATKVAELAHIGMTRAIDPVNLMGDGDIVFALSCGSERAAVDAVGVAAAEAVSAAIIRAVRTARSMGGVPGLATLKP
jgi:L-aminopeptidase/D-esterase-like protein